MRALLVVVGGGFHKDLREPLFRPAGPVLLGDLESQKLGFPLNMAFPNWLSPQKIGFPQTWSSFGVPLPSPKRVPCRPHRPLSPYTSNAKHASTNRGFLLPPQKVREHLLRVRKTRGEFFSHCQKATQGSRDFARARVLVLVVLCQQGRLGGSHLALQSETRRARPPRRLGL